MLRKNNTKGFTLIEIAIVLTIVGLVIGGIWLAASTVIGNNKAGNLSKSIIQVIQNTKTLFSAQGAATVTTGFSLGNAVSAGIFPPEMIANATTPVIVTPFNQDNTVNAFTIAVVGTTGLTYTIGAAAPNGIPQNACTQLLTTIGTLNNMQRLGITAVGGTALTDLTTGGTVAVTPAAAAGACSSTTNGNRILVTFNAA